MVNPLKRGVAAGLLSQANFARAQLTAVKAMLEVSLTGENVSDPWFLTLRKVVESIEAGIKIIDDKEDADS